MLRILALMPLFSLLALASCSDTNEPAPTVDASVPIIDQARPDLPSQIDTGANPDTSAPVDCAVPLGGQTSGEHVFRFEHPTDDLRIHLVRKYKDHGVGESSLYDLKKMLIYREGQCVTVEDPAALHYENSHHNWFDQAHSTADGIRYELEMVYQNAGAPGWKITARAVELSSSNVLWGPLELLTTGGPFDAWYGPGWLPVRIHEFMTANSSTWQDDAGDHDPWIELFNPSSSAQDVSGYFISNDPKNRQLWTIPAGTTIGRHEYLLVVADNQPEQGPLHTNFRLSTDGGAIVLTAPDGQTLGERLYGPQTDGSSMILSWDSGDYEVSSSPTPGAANPGD